MYLEAAAKAEPDSVNSVITLQFKARVHESLGQTKEALEAYRQSLKIEPDSLESLASLIRLALATNERDTALVNLRRYTVAAGADAAGLATAANFHYLLGRFDDASDLAAGR